MVDTPIYQLQFIQSETSHYLFENKFNSIIEHFDSVANSYPKLSPLIDEGGKDISQYIALHFYEWIVSLKNNPRNKTTDIDKLFEENIYEKWSVHYASSLDWKNITVCLYAGILALMLAKHHYNKNKELGWNWLCEAQYFYTTLGTISVCNGQQIL
ncbi:MAG: hypothetical protein ACQEWL_21125 [Pseudomonadota bacterium]|uniref:hypothetical protein n=1 Tax=Providencia TaxID=586 RepID=UPI0024B0A3F8